MKKRYPLILSSAALFSLGVGLSAPQPETVIPPPGSSDDSILFEQIREDVTRAIQTNADAPSYTDWGTSGYTPREIFENVRALRKPMAWNALCKALQVLKSDELALFSEEIEASPSLSAAGHTSNLLPCAPELSARIGQHWQAESTRLEATFRARAGRLGGPSGNEDRDASLILPKILPSKQIEVDADASPTLVDGNPGAPLGPKEISITIDDGPHATRTPRLLRILKENGIRANFFQVGENARALPALSRKLVEDGHIVGSHSHSHPQLSRMSPKAAESQILNGRTEVASAAGVNIPFFRFPYGASTLGLREFLKDQKIASFLWNMDSLDWKYRDTTVLYDNILKKLDKYDHGIMLFHDIQEQTVLVFPRVVEELKRRGYTTVVFVPRQR